MGATRRTDPRATASVTRFDLHVRDALEQSLPAQLRPPLVQEDLDRPPHRDPAEDEQAFGENRRGGVVAASEQLAKQQAHTEEGEADQQTDDATTQEQTQLLTSVTAS